MMIKRAAFALALGTLIVSPVQAQQAQDGANTPPEHTEPFPNLSIGRDRAAARKSFELAPYLERAVPAKDMLEQQRRLNRSLSALAPQRPGVVDAYVVSVALDSDPVFAREAREAGRVLARRYDGEGRTLTLAGPDGTRDDLAQGSVPSFLISLAHIAEVMDRDEDVLVVYTTSHGMKLGLVNHYGDSAYGILPPARFKQALDELGIKRRLLILSACYSGVFVPALASSETAIVTAASSQRTSFGCEPDNDWTFFGDAMINRALRKPQSLGEAVKEANRKVAEWETKRRLLASLPQSAIGDGARTWLADFEARMPQTATQPVGQAAAGE